MKSAIKIFFLGIFLFVLAQCSVQTSENTSIKTLFVSAEQKDCSNGAGTQKCMLVREKPTEQWSYFYSNIDGFNYEPGYDYVLTVSTAKIANPPADASSIKYTLIKQISKTKREQ
ncbi:DUF4377 domain-containing protein [Chryseobacterium sp. POL2]|uniref:DUF4377 domain-containing protein n=1 Tax=Chryseobacterium sp. POL2 TaxID=2713414 RepID=UPI0013E18B01|nr:DUF4377 domain-containing protein [Chryseobacterium sp. POL2]QIG88457.1 DUF4377 domain-containing protein [Chryseobacterium sp. POL2]